MLDIAICDYNYEMCRETAEIVTKLLFDETEVHFTFYENGMQIMEDILEEKFRADLLFMEIMVPGVDGMRVIKFLRAQQLATDVIFLTEASEMAAEGYQYYAFDYLIKPVPIKRLEGCMQRYIEDRLYASSGTINVNIRGCSQKIQLQKVLYFESRERRISAVTADDEIVFYQKMNELQEMLRENVFIRCHQSYIVNIDYISSVTATGILLVNKKKIPVSKRYSRKVRESILNLQ